MPARRGGAGSEPPVPDYIDEHHQRIHEFALDYLDPEEIDDFVDSLLERHGYQRETRWAAPAGDDGQGGGGGRRQPLIKQRAAGGRGRGGQAAGREGGSYFRR